MSESTGNDETDNPFATGPEYNLINFVQLSRIYDVLMTLVQIQDPAAAERLLATHAEGHLVNPSPQYTGEFVFDSLNAAQSEQDTP